VQSKKFPDEFKEIFIILLKKHCCSFSDLLLHKYCKIKSCKVYENAEDFYNKYNTIFVKLQKKIYNDIC